jgi:hypothetical protein
VYELGITAVVADAGNLQFLTADEIAAPAGLAYAAVPAMPTYADPITHFPIAGAFSDSVDYTRDLVPGRTRIDDPGKGTLLGEDVAMTDPARLNSDSDRSGLGLADLFLNQLEGSTGAIYAYCFHGLASPNQRWSLFEP